MFCVMVNNGKMILIVKQIRMSRIWGGINSEAVYAHPLTFVTNYNRDCLDKSNLVRAYKQLKFNLQKAFRQLD